MNHQHRSRDLILPFDAYHEQEFLKIVLYWSPEQLHKKSLQNHKVCIQPLRNNTQWQNVGLKSLNSLFYEAYYLKFL